MNISEIENKIINADCMDILKKLPDKSIDLILTDPPYGGGAVMLGKEKALKVRRAV
jgi:DNA modification methylase